MAPQWLERLGRATEYRELHDLFAEIAADARTAQNQLEFANYIDEAIGRLLKETRYDKEDLQKVAVAYDSFKEQHSGCIGWLLRHLPFTAPRRQEKLYNRNLADRQAEMLANRMIIARAEIIKEQLLPPDTRQLGHSFNQWQQRLTECNSLARIHELAARVRDLRLEIEQSQAFVKRLDSDLDAFANARFSEQEDQRRKDVDLSAARNELSVLKSEISSEQSLRADSIQLLGRIVSDDLSSGDSNYRSILHRLGMLETASERAKKAEDSFKQLHSSIEPIYQSAKELESIPDRRQRLFEQIQKIKRDAEDADRRRAKLAADFASHVTRYDTAKDNVDRARSGVNAAKGVYDAYLVEIGAVELPPDDSSPVAAEYARRQDELKRAEAELKTIARPYEAAKSDLRRAEQEAEALQNKATKLKHEEDSLGQQLQQLRAKVNAAQVHLREAIVAAEKNAEHFMEALGPIDRDNAKLEFDRIIPNSQWGSSPLAPSSDSKHDLKQTQDLYARALRHLKEVRDSLDRDLSSNEEHRKSLFAARCTELLGDKLSKEVCQQ